MNLIVLAAGKGDRMGVLTKDKPKSLLNLDGTTLLERQLASIEGCRDVEKIVYVLGYMAEAIEEKLQSLKCEKAVTVFNPFYDISNNLISLWFAKYYMDEDFIVTNGDNLFHPDVFKDIAGNRDGIYLTIHQKEQYDNDDMKVKLGNGLVIKVSKLIFEGEADCESVGLAVVSGKEHREVFRKYLEKLARSKDYLDKFWLEVFNALAKDNVKIAPVHINGGWQEFDYHRDIERYSPEWDKNEE